MNCQAIFQRGFWLAGVLVLYLLLLSCPLPVLAEKQTDSQLEEQVLRIIHDHPEAIIESVQTYQQQQQEKQQQALRTFSQAIKTNTEEVINDSPTTGLAESRIVLVEFSDFQCPYCAEAHKTINRFMAKHRDKVKLVYKHFPLTAIHPEAMSAAKAAWAAGQQGKFWEYHNALFSQQNKLGGDLYLDIAKNLKLNLNQFNKDRNGNAADAAIQKDIQLAQRLRIAGTPFFIMNDEAFSGAVQLTDMENILTRVSKSL